MVERKCPNCGTWNKDEKYCIQCNTPIHPNEIERLDRLKRIELEKKAAIAKDDRLKKLIRKAQASPNPFVRILYYLLYSVTFIVVGMGAFVAWLVAWAAA